MVSLVGPTSVPEPEVAPTPDPQIAAQVRIDEAAAQAEADEQAAAELAARREALANGSTIEQSTSDAAAGAAREVSEAALAEAALRVAEEEVERQAELAALVTPTPVPQPTATPQPTPQPTAVPTVTTAPEPTVDPTGGPTAAQWAAVRACESGGNYSINTGNGYYGAYQFSPVTWANLANSFMPEVAGILPHQASPAQQDAMAAELYRRYGRGQWPTCGLSLPA